jgi:hypothetical protein
MDTNRNIDIDRRLVAPFGGDTPEEWDEFLRTVAFALTKTGPRQGRMVIQGGELVDGVASLMPGSRFGVCLTGTPELVHSVVTRTGIARKGNVQLARFPHSISALPVLASVSDGAVTLPEQDLLAHGLAASGWRLTQLEEGLFDLFAATHAAALLEAWSECELVERKYPEFTTRGRRKPATRASPERARRKATKKRAREQLE